MVWTAPQTWTTGQVVTAADMNGDVRDNMLETAAASASAAGDVVYADAANSMGSVLSHPGTGRMLVSDASNGLAWRQTAEDVNYSDASTSSTFTNTTYSPTGAEPSLPSVTVTTGTAAIVIVSCDSMGNDTADAVTLIAYSVSGASTVAASDDLAARFKTTDVNSRAGISSLKLQSLTAGSNTFQMEARVSAGTGTILRPRILVIPR